MAKASIQMPNGTVVQIEGTPEEVKKLLEFYGGDLPSKKTKKSPVRSKKTEVSSMENRDTKQVDLSEIINLVKNCEDSEAIETKILDKTSQVNRILLPMYIVYENLDNAFGLTSVEISRITKDLGIPIQQPNVSKTLSGTASKYVVGDRIRKKGHAVRYKLSRRGVKYLSGLIRGTKDG